MLSEVLAASGDGIHIPGLNWQAIVIASIPGVLAVLAVIVGKVIDWRKSNVDSDQAKESRREPTWHELVGENRSLRSDLLALEDRFEEHKKDTADLKGKIASMEIERKLSERIEVLMYRHTQELRNHIINELPPPPPTAPQELVDWFAQFENTDPGRMNLHSI